MQNVEQKLNQETYQDAIAFTFDHFDDDKDGNLDRKEFSKMLGAIQKAIPFPLTQDLIDYLFKKFDKNQRGILCIEDLSPILTRAYFSTN